MARRKTHKRIVKTTIVVPKWQRDLRTRGRKTGAQLKNAFALVGILVVLVFLASRLMEGG